MAAPLAGQVALVTGASSGIGESTAVMLGEAGAKVACVARRADRLKGLVARITAAGGTAIALPGDMTKQDVATGAVKDAIKHFGRLDILANCAGIMEVGQMETANIPEWQRMMDSNLYAAMYTCAAAVPQMLSQGSGTIINVASLSVRTTSPFYNSYCASKSALWAMTDGMRKEIGPKNVRVCMVAPGATNTEVADGISDPQHRKFISDYVKQDGAMQPENVAGALVYIACAPPHVTISELWIRATKDVAY